MEIWYNFVAQCYKNPPASAGDSGASGLMPGREGPLEEEMATHSSILAWKISWTEEPGEGGAGYSPLGPEESDTTERALSDEIRLDHSFPHSVENLGNSIC